MVKALCALYSARPSLQRGMWRLFGGGCFLSVF